MCRSGGWNGKRKFHFYDQFFNAFSFHSFIRKRLKHNGGYDPSELFDVISRRGKKITIKRLSGRNFVLSINFKQFSWSWDVNISPLFCSRRSSFFLEYFSRMLFDGMFFLMRLKLCRGTKLFYAFLTNSILWGKSFACIKKEEKEKKTSSAST